MTSFKKSKKQYEVDLQNHLHEGLIKRTRYDDAVFNTYINNHLESIEVAEELFGNNASNLWTIVVSYYSMFYVANAVLHKLGYKVGHKIAHQVTATAIRVLLKQKLNEQLMREYELASAEALSLTDTLLESYEQERVKRAKFQYEMTEEIKHSKASTSLLRAKKFSKEMMRLISESL